MDDLPDDQGQSDAHPSDPNWWSSHAEHKFGSISLTKQERNSGSPGSSHCGEGDHSLWAAQTLWCTGYLSSPIPNGFYSIIPVSVNFIRGIELLNKNISDSSVHFNFNPHFKICRIRN